jgi:hypothetical protein
MRNFSGRRRKIKTGILYPINFVTNLAPREIKKSIPLQALRVPGG